MNSWIVEDDGSGNLALKDLTLGDYGVEEEVSGKLCLWMVNDEREPHWLDVENGEWWKENYPEWDIKLSVIYKKGSGTKITLTV